MKKYITILILALVFATVAVGKTKQSRTVTFRTSMHCAHCEKKIVENVSFEKGVNDLKTNLGTKEVTFVFNPEKTDTAKLAASIRKLGYSAQVVNYR